MYQCKVDLDMLNVKIKLADVSSVSPSSEQRWFNKKFNRPTLHYNNPVLDC